jgi:two-component system response regulator AtoC
MNVLIEYGWPGNVRELRSAIEQAVCLGEAKLDTLEPKNLPPAIRLNQKNANLEPETLGEELREVERKKIIETLIKNNGHKGKTAEELGISRRTLYYKMEELRIKLHSG